MASDRERNAFFISFSSTSPALIANAFAWATAGSSSITSMRLPATMTWQRHLPLGGSTGRGRESLAAASRCFFIFLLSTWFHSHCDVKWEGRVSTKTSTLIPRLGVSGTGVGIFICLVYAASHKGGEDVFGDIVTLWQIFFPL